MPDLTTTDAAALLGVTAIQVRRLISRGRIAARREDTPRGPILWITREAVDHYRATRRPAGRPPARKEETR